jgi:hypothetical protein
MIDESSKCTVQRLKELNYLFFLSDSVRVSMAAIFDTTDFFWMPCPGVRYSCISDSKHRHDFNVLRFLPESLWETQAQLTCFRYVFSRKFSKDDERK